MPEATVKHMRSLSKRRKATAVWAAWFASLMGSPSMLTSLEANVPLATEGAYGYIALGLLVGMCAATHPALNRSYRWNSLLAVVLSIVGIIGCCVLCLISLCHITFAAFQARLILPTFFWNEGRPWEMPLFNYLYIKFLAPGLTPFQGLLPGFAGLDAVLCGGIGWLLLRPPAADGRKYEDMYAPPATARQRRLLWGVALASFVVGCTRLFAWSILLPHPPMPFEPQGQDTLNAEWMHFLFAPMAIPMVICGCVAAAAIVWSRSAASRMSGPLCVLVSIAVGELVVRILARTCMDSFSFFEVYAWVALGIHVLAVAMLIIVSRCALARGPLRLECVAAAQNGSMLAPISEHPIARTLDAYGAFHVENLSVDELRRALPFAARTFLEAKGLSLREVDILQGAALGMNSVQIATVLGIKESTTRSYGGRVRRKLKVASIDEALKMVFAAVGGEPKGTGTIQGDAPVALARIALRTMPADADEGFKGDGDRISQQSRFGFALQVASFVGVLVLILLLVLPFGEAPRTWQMAWITAFGIALGMLGYMGVRFLFPASYAGVLPPVIVAVALGSSALVLVCVRIQGGSLPLSASGGLRLGIVTAGGLFVTSSLVALRLLVQRTPAFAEIWSVDHDGRSNVEQAMARGTLGLSVPLLAVLVLASFSKIAWTACSLGAGIVALLGLVLIVRRPACGHPQSERRSSAAFLELLCATGVLFALEELWRGMFYASLFTYLIPFLIIIALSLVLNSVLGHRAGFSSYGIMAALAVIVVALCLQMGGSFALVAFDLAVGGAVYALRLVRSKDGLANNDSGASIAVDRVLAWHMPRMAGAGCVAGVLVGNVYGICLLTPEVKTAFGTYADLATLISWMTGALFAVFALLLVARIVDRTIFVAGNSLIGLPESENALRAYLIAQGLKSRQLEILMCIAEGLDTLGIADRLGYAPVTVAFERRRALNGIGVSDVSEYRATVQDIFNPKRG